MSIIDTDIEKFENLFEGMTKKPSLSKSRVMLESVALGNSKKILEEAQTKKKKSFQKKLKLDNSKKASILKTKKVLSSLFESFVSDNGLVLDTPAKQRFYEALEQANSALKDVASEHGDDFEKYYELYEKFYKTGNLTTEEKAFLDSNDPEKDFDEKSASFGSKEPEAFNTFTPKNTIKEDAFSSTNSNIEKASIGPW